MNNTIKTIVSDINTAHICIESVKNKKDIEYKGVMSRYQSILDENDYKFLKENEIGFFTMVLERKCKELEDALSQLEDTKEEMIKLRRIMSENTCDTAKSILIKKIESSKYGREAISEDFVDESIRKLDIRVDEIVVEVLKRVDIDTANKLNNYEKLKSYIVRLEEFEKAQKMQNRSFDVAIHCVWIILIILCVIIYIYK